MPRQAELGRVPFKKSRQREVPAEASKQKQRGGNAARLDMKI